MVLCCPPPPPPFPTHCVPSCLMLFAYPPPHHPCHSSLTLYGMLLPTVLLSHLDSLLFLFFASPKSASVPRKQGLGVNFRRPQSWDMPSDCSHFHEPLSCAEKQRRMPPRNYVAQNGRPCRRRVLKPWRQYVGDRTRDTCRTATSTPCTTRPQVTLFSLEKGLTSLRLL